MKMKLPTLLAIAVGTALSASLVHSAEIPAAWKEHCAICHGNDGKGKTKAGIKAKVKDLTDAKFQESFTDEKALEDVKEGVKEDGKTRMKPFKDKLSDDEIKKLIAFVRTLKS